MNESKILKWTGLIMIIGGALMTVMLVLSLFGGIMVSGGSTSLGGLLIILSIIGLAAAVLELVAGIMGFRSWNVPQKAQGCFVMGIVLIVLSLVNNVGTIALGGFSAQNVGGLLLGLVLPALYTYGASQLKKGA